MKRKIFVVLMFLLVPCFVLTGCGEHQHTFSENWTASAEEHWHACLDDNCEEKSENEKHTFVDVDSNGTIIQKCKCGYTKR